MLSPVMLAYVFVLFFVLTPGVLVSLPPRGSKLAVAATHALVFVVLYQLTHKMAMKMALQLEGFQGNNMAPPSMNAANMNAANMPRKN
jgi:hypothetical protein